MRDTTGLDIATKRFKVTRRGYDRVEVDAYLADLLEEFSRRGVALRRAEMRAGDLEDEIAELRDRVEESSQAVAAAVEAKYRILDDAAERAEAILRDSYEQRFDDAGRANTYAAVDRMELLAVWDPDSEPPLIDAPGAATRYQQRSAHLPRLGTRSSRVLNDVAELRSKALRHD